jgi:multidrug resistance efflux pump
MKSSFQRSPRLRHPLRPAESENSSAVETNSGDFTANMQLAYLESLVKDWREDLAADQPQAEAAAPDSPTQDLVKKHPPFQLPLDLRASTVLKSCLALAVAVMLGWVPVQRLLATTSAEATVNARLITVRAPIEGDVSMALTSADIGTKFQSGDEILTVRNPRSDSSSLTGLRRERDQLKTSISVLEEKQQVLLGNLDELKAQQERFRIGRVEQLEQRVLETDSDIASAEAQYSTASAALVRANSLKRTDAVSQAFLDTAVRDERMAVQTIRGLSERRKGMLVELESAKSGTFIGDSYNDTPQSAQRKMEVSLELADVRARLGGSKTELAAIDANIAAETKRHEELSTAVLRSTVDGRIWEMLTAPGEHVNAGQDLLRLLDCGSAMVTASVSEMAYQRLAIGQKATFKPRDGGAELVGSVVGLNGLAAVASNSAIQQNALSREPYHVTLKFPELARGGDCQIGRSGLVQFDTASVAGSAMVP